MADSARLPSVQAWPACPVEYHKWFRQVDAAISSGSSSAVNVAAIAADVSALDARVTSLEAAGGATITGARSVRVVGGQAQLHNDLTTPDALSLYGTDENGRRGWHSNAFTQPSVGAITRTMLAKARDFVSVKDFGAIGDGATDDTSAVQAALDVLTTGASLIFPKGRYLVSSAIARASVDDIKLVGDGAVLVETTPSITNLVSFTSCNRVAIQGLAFEGGETHAYFAANSPATARSFLKLSACDGAIVSNVYGTGKRRFVELYSCTNSRVDGVQFSGFFQDLALGLQAEAENAPCVTFSNCSNCIASGIVVDHHGSAFLSVQSGDHIVATGITASELHDNCVYISSGTNCMASAVSAKNVYVQGVKMRGNNNTATGCVLENCISGGIHLTGNGLVADSFGANGYNLVAVGNVISGCGNAGINVGVQDGIYPRDVVVANNAISGMATAGDWAGIRVFALRGVSVLGNITRTHASDYGIVVSGPASGTKVYDINVSGNTVGDVNGSAASTRGGILIQYASSFKADNNIFNDIASGIGVRIIGSTSGTAMGNVYVGGQVVRCPSGESNTGVLIANNVGASINAAADVNVVGFNYAPTVSYAAIASTPPAVGAITHSGADAYIATGVASSADWKKITP